MGISLSYSHHESGSIEPGDTEALTLKFGRYQGIALNPFLCGMLIDLLTQDLQLDHLVKKKLS